ncbi:MAG: lysophospholipid acyltransferase family protein [Alphaproteobacteria bacterium]
MIVQRIRSLIFDVIFYPCTFLILATGSLFWWGPRVLSGWVYPSHSYMTSFLLRWIVGLNHRVEGLEHLIDGPVIIASKHQSAWDTFIFGQYLCDPAIVYKKDLQWLPPLGFILMHQKMIPVSRGKGKSALKELMGASRQAVELARPILIFPEGTRQPPGAKTKCQAGTGVLYQMLDIPVIPVALNSGYFWGRRSFFKKPGTMVLRFLPAIAPGLERAQFLHELETRIEEACQDIDPTINHD